MSVRFDDPYCDIYGCNRSKNTEGQTVTFAIKGVPTVVTPCNYHFEMFEVMDPSLYSVGLTYNNAVEIRLHPAVPVMPAQ